MPRISPSRISRLTLRTVSPGMSTQRLRIDIIVPAPDRSRTSREVGMSTFLPTMYLEILLTEVSEAGSSSTMSPSRITTTRLQTARISCSLCVIKMTAMPFADIFRIELRSASASFSVRTAVGSSRIRIFSCSLLSSRAISVNCLWPTGISLISMFLSMEKPIFSMAASARPFISL